MPDPIRYAELRTARDWGIPINEWDRLPVDAKMEMMAHVEVNERIDAYIRSQRDRWRRGKSKHRALELRKGRP